MKFTQEQIDTALASGQEVWGAFRLDNGEEFNGTALDLYPDGKFFLDGIEADQTKNVYQITETANA